ncbi:FMN-dependent NADH-azoreductase [Luteimonas deserti]|uniref:FMN dependent NADH:quinone oxidoreductase n=1 Tax=Luteimonas deserti TaxID=2752306 RepID=A0A7Z0TV26_9GAMM|nr:NAD(P)H-dependent oxidoreductase [Luteimonas deserti]NYZ61789.1 NAD(P)H-dependent oxidoreductase [Luteimonas deserti]
MTTLLHIDASARPGLAGAAAHGSHSRALSARFVERWLRAAPDTTVLRRDIGLAPPAHVDHAWIAAAFAAPSDATGAMRARLAESDRLIDELFAADVVVIGTALYNFGMPSTLKAWVDNIIRVGRTVDIDPSRADPYTPLLADRPRTAVVLAARGGHDQDPGGACAHMNHLEAHLRVALDFIGLRDMRSIAVEHQEAGGARLAASVAAAERAVDALVDRLQATTPAARRASRAA